MAEFLRDKTIKYLNRDFTSLKRDLIEYTKARKYIIYALCCPTTLKIRYIGKSSIGLLRPKQHWTNKKRLNDGTHVHNWCRKLLNEGKVPTIQIIEQFDYTNDIKQVLNEAEIKWIKFFRRNSRGLTNISDGGEGAALTLEHRQKISNGMLGEKNHFYGKSHSDEAKQLISQKKLGKKLSAETRKKMSISKSGEKHVNYGKAATPDELRRLKEIGSKKVICITDGKFFSSQREAGLYYNLTSAAISMICIGKNKQTRTGLQFRLI